MSKESSSSVEEYNCLNCKDTKMSVTDLWNVDTTAMYQPCPQCSMDELQEFYESSPKKQVRWFKKSRIKEFLKKLKKLSKFRNN